MEYKSKQTLVIRIQKTNHLHVCVQGGGGGALLKLIQTIQKLIFFLLIKHFCLISIFAFHSSSALYLFIF